MATIHQLRMALRAGGSAAAAAERCIGEDAEARRTRAGEADVQAIRRGGQRRLRCGAVGQHGVGGRAQVVADAAHVVDERACAAECRATAPAASPSPTSPTASRPNTDLGLAERRGALRADEHRVEARQALDRLDVLADTPDAASCGRRGTPKRRRRARRPDRSQSTPLAGLMRRTARSTAAASDDPPPMPAAMGSCLSTLTRPRVRIGSAAARAARAVSTRLSPAMAEAYGPVISTAAGTPGSNVTHRRRRRRR